MNRLFIFSTLLAAGLVYSGMAFADSDVTAEQKTQNTPSGWTAVSLPQIRAITKVNTVTITDFGASTSSKDNTAAIQKALDAVPAEGGMVVVPKGRWLCGPIMIKAKASTASCERCYAQACYHSDNILEQKTTCSMSLRRENSKISSISKIRTHRI